MNVAILIVILYNLNEKNKFKHEKLNLNRSRMFLRKHESEKKKIQIKFFTAQSNFMTRIVKIYVDDKIFQRIIQIKKNKNRDISIDFTRE